jgi:hypothetical protein
MIAPKLQMRSGFAISVIGHVTVLTLALIFAGAIPFDSVPAEAITVDIVSPDEAGPAPILTEPLPETVPSFEAMAPAGPPLAAAAPPPTPPAPQPQPAPRPNPQRNTRQAAVQPPQPIEPLFPPPTPMPQPPPEPSVAGPHEPDITDMFGLPLALPDGRLGGGFDTAAYDIAKLPASDTARFRDHLKTCLLLPASVARTDKVRIVLRVGFKPDGTLAATPTLIEASASEKGPAMMQSIVKGLRACQPYAMLPADKYKEWKVLDLGFTPQDFAGS